MDNDSMTNLGMASKATYQITTKGKLGANWADWFNGTSISVEPRLEGKPHTILTCQVRDQSELLGILNRLNSLNMPLLKVKVVNSS